MIWYILMALAGVIVGFGLAYLLRPKNVGVIRVDSSDKDGPYLFLELNHDGMDTINKRQYITLKVNRQSYISQK